MNQVHSSIINVVRNNVVRNVGACLIILTLFNIGCGRNVDAHSQENGETTSEDTSSPETSSRRKTVSPTILEVPQRPKTPPLLPLVETSTPLRVPGYNDASHVGPTVRNAGPKPVVVVLHGNFDRPEWQCDMWKDVASWYGWILCPRGVRTEAATLQEDRWTYKGGAAAVHREIHAGLEALEKTYPGAVTRDGMVLVGFSLGAIWAPEIIILNENLFETVFLVEGGLQQLEWSLSQLQKFGVKAIGVAMSLPKNRDRALKLAPKILKKGYTYKYVDMRGGGHNYREDFSHTGRLALEELLGEGASHVGALREALPNNR